jgi:hypothetical protein
MVITLYCQKFLTQKYSEKYETRKNKLRSLFKSTYLTCESYESCETSPSRGGKYEDKSFRDGGETRLQNVVLLQRDYTAL